MGVDELLRRLGPTEVAPSVADLGGEGEVLSEVVGLDPQLLPRLIEAVVGDWRSVDRPDRVGVALVSRLHDIPGVTSFATSLDALLLATVATESTEMARALMKALLDITAEAGTDAERALRAGHAVRAAVDLALLDVGVTPHGVLAAIENVEDVPVEMASALARAAGRLWEHYDEAFLEAVLEERLLPHDRAAADATVELGLKAMRDAFAAHNSDEATDALTRSTALFERARSFEEDRADARAYQAAAQAVLGFGAGADELSAALDELTVARGELERYEVDVGETFRGASPLRSVAAWHVLAATLRELRAHLEEPPILNLRPAIEALADAYSGLRLGVLQDERLGLRAFIQPVIAGGVTSDSSLVRGMSQLANEPNAARGAQELSDEVVRPKVSPRLGRLKP